jgi:cytochrome c
MRPAFASIPVLFLMSGVALADVTLPPMDAKRGRELYISKGCIGCHAINGVGGQHAAPLDAATMDPAMNPFEFFARMWIGIKPMIEMQEDKMGQQVDLTAQELGDLVAFIHDAGLQKSITISEIPDNIEDIMED